MIVSKLQSTMTSIASNIRNISGTTYIMGLDDMANNLSGINAEIYNQAELIEQIIDTFNKKTESIEDMLIMGTIKTYENSNIKNIGNYAFDRCYDLTTVSFPNCITIGNSAFQNCLNLTSVSFPVCTSIGNYAFNNCSKLTSVSFPECTILNQGAFYDCDNLAFVNFPKCTNISIYAFAFCSKLTSVSFPECTIINQGAFSNCSSLTSVNFPNCTTINRNTFYNCYSLTYVSFPNCITIDSNTFYSCYNLSQVYLTGSSLCILSNSNAFTSTPFMGYSSYFSGTPYIYVPESLVTSYQNATNWTYFSSYIVGI